jgi:hypothetical protein
MGLYMVGHARPTPPKLRLDRPRAEREDGLDAAMVVYNFKKIETVPTADALIDAILSKTQRKTPTVVHPNYNIVRIRQFYMRKVKFTQSCAAPPPLARPRWASAQSAPRRALRAARRSYQERLTQIVTDFPRLEDIHPFYADLVNVLYDRDHFKLALGQVNIARQLIDSVGKDYVKLLKYGDSLYRCKCLKVRVTLSLSLSLSLSLTLCLSLALTLTLSLALTLTLSLALTLTLTSALRSGACAR